MEYLCTICAEPLEFEEEKPAAIPCGHVFHNKCLTTWLNVACKCPICNAATIITQIGSPLYFSSSRENFSQKSSSELEALVKEATRKRKRDKEALRESRITNKFLYEEIKKYKNLTQKSSSGPMTYELNKARCDLLKIQNDLKLKESQLTKAKEEHKRLMDKLQVEQAKTKKAKREHDEAKELLKITKSKLAIIKSEVTEVKSQAAVAKVIHHRKTTEYTKIVKDQSTELQTVKLQLRDTKRKMKVYYAQLKQLENGGNRDEQPVVRAKRKPGSNSKLRAACSHVVSLISDSD